MNKPISASGLLKELSIGGVEEELRVAPKNAISLGVVRFFVAEVEDGAE